MPAAFPGSSVAGEPVAPRSYVVSARSAAPRELLYSPAYGFPVRLRTGCAMQCSYCTAANMGRVHGDGDVGEVVDEIAALVAAARARGLPMLPLFLAADEVNLPDARLLEELLAASSSATSRRRCTGAATSTRRRSTTSCAG